MILVSPTPLWRASALSLLLSAHVLLAQNPDNPNDDPLATRQYFVEKRTTTGTIAISAYDAALAQAQGLQEYSTRTDITSAASANGAYLPSPSGWTWVGPDNVGGRTRTLIVHPAFSSNGVIYAAGSDGWLPGLPTAAF